MLEHDGAVGGAGAAAYADAVATYLGFLVDQECNQSSTICGWNNINQQMIVTFSRQAIPMVWDYAEVNILGEAAGGYDSAARAVVRVVKRLNPGARAHALQADAAHVELSGRLVSTDPPYYDNISYADLSDFFYVWLRRSLQRSRPIPNRCARWPRSVAPRSMRR